jgi:hypothetical protein
LVVTLLTVTVVAFVNVTVHGGSPFDAPAAYAPATRNEASDLLVLLDVIVAVALVAPAEIAVAPV